MRELPVLDPFGDYEVAGYLRNIYREKDLRIIGRLETASFQEQVHSVTRTLRRLRRIDYSTLTNTHKSLFSSVYPWAGQDRSENAPHIAIAKAGYKTLFAHPADVRRAAEFALDMGSDPKQLQARPGHVFAYLAHAHPFLEGNGRTLLTVYADMCRRANFHIRWETIEKTEFLHALTDELLAPGCIMDDLLLPRLRQGVLSSIGTARQLSSNFRHRE